MPKYSESVIEAIKTRLTPSDVIGNYVRLTRRGDRHWGCCPFHHEKTPSFTVLDSGGFYKCFGCGKGGSVFNFIMEMEHVGFNEAVEILAKKAGIELQEEREQDRAQHNRQKALSDLYNKIYKTFNYVLLNKNEAQNARDYIAKRKISSETVEKFQLGYAIDDPNWLYNYLLSHNYSEELLKESGLFSKNYEHLPLFRNRVLFPIRNWQGNCVAFGGRDLSGESKAKYINTPDTSIYSKRHNLFGFYESLQTLKEKGEIILCEGNFDVISLHQAGITNACAPLGTAFTEEQATLIKRYCSKVNILFDSDDAGQNATKKALLICQKNDLENRVIKLEGAKDASQMLEEMGPEAVVNSCLNSIGGFSYLVSRAIKLYDIRQPKGKSSVFEEVKPYLDATSSSIERQGYIKYLADVLRIKEEQVLIDYRNQQRNERPVEDNVKVIKHKYNPLKLSAELSVMLTLVNNRELFPEFRNQVKVSSLDDYGAQVLYTVLEDASRQDIRTNDLLLEMIGDTDLRELVVLSFTSKLYAKENARKIMNEAIFRINLKILEEKRQNIQRLISSGETDNLSQREMENLLMAVVALDKDIEDLKKGATEVEEN
ncbi:MAG: DNA primase [Sphaerochaetaceae bacterium]|nr:DNA primase [Sphaerochaetaceae bacterium]